MTRPHLRRALAGAAAVLALPVAYSCARQAPASSCHATPETGLAIALGARANSAAPAPLPGEVQKEIDEVIAAAGDNGKAAVTLIRVDGQPSIACTVTLDLDGIATDEARNNLRAGFRNNIASRVNEVRAVEGEADVLKALQLASETAGPGGTVVLIDSGLQTVNPLNFTTVGLLDAGADYLAGLVVDGNHLHDLDGQTVILVGIGDTAPPQPPLFESQQEHLEAIWEAIVRRAGATDVTVLSGGGAATAVTDVPPVTAVPVPDVGAFAPDCNATIVLYEDQIGFLPNSTELHTPAQTRELLVPIAAWLRDNRRGHAHLVGSIAHYGSPTDTSLSLARAERVKQLLVDLGADGARITTEGIGWGHVPAPDAPPDPAIDPLNRRVVVGLSCS